MKQTIALTLITFAVVACNQSEEVNTRTNIAHASGNKDGDQKQVKKKVVAADSTGFALNKGTGFYEGLVNARCKAPKRFDRYVNGKVAETTTISYVYDAEDRLVEAQVAGQVQLASSAAKISVSYDSSGRILSSAGLSGVYNVQYDDKKGKAVVAVINQDNTTFNEQIDLNWKSIVSAKGKRYYKFLDNNTDESSHPFFAILPIDEPGVTCTEDREHGAFTCVSESATERSTEKFAVVKETRKDGNSRYRKLLLESMTERKVADGPFVSTAEDAMKYNDQWILIEQVGKSRSVADSEWVTKTLSTKVDTDGCAILEKSVDGVVQEKYSY